MRMILPAVALCVVRCALCVVRCPGPRDIEYEKKGLRTSTRIRMESQG